MNSSSKPSPLRDRTVLVIGASAGLGRALAAACAETGAHLVLVARERRDLDAMAADLRLVYGVQAVPFPVDLATPGLDCERIAQLCRTMPPIAAVLAPAGMVTKTDSNGLASAQAEALLRANFLTIAQLIQTTIPLLDRAKGAVIVGFGSVAATRGRSRNVFYAAAKRALQTYFESLRHGLQAEGVRVQFYVPGYINTNLAAEADVRLPKADPEAFARHVVKNLDKDFGVRYYPHWWVYLCAILRLLPWFIFRRVRL